ncbi:MAG: helix-turn-helix transcriptional regulator [Bacteroidales bacterium]|nr:helix-turn-helix transcriptional regulator [Bacteroidales bacterium]
MDNSTIKDNIRRIRKSRRLTQEDMALRLGISLTAYRDMEKGSTSMMNANVGRIADLLETTPEELVLGYRPVQMPEKILEDAQERYGIRIETMEKRVADLEKLVDSLEETIRSKNEIIGMLKKSLDKDK